MKKLSYIVLTALLSLSAYSAYAMQDGADDKAAKAKAAEEERCTVPAFAKAIGHEELWKKHNGCLAEDEHKKDE